jgi:hypothetical protein
MRSALADPVHGFNAKLAAIAADYGIDAFIIDWAASGSENFLQSFVEGASRDTSRLTGISVALYTSQSQQNRDQIVSKGLVFSGTIQAHLDFDLKFDGGADVTDDLTEAYADAVEDAVIAVLVDRASPVAVQQPIYFRGDFSSIRGPIDQTAAGYSQLLPFTFLYEVHV